MGTYSKGANGPFSGKTGSIIGSRWKDVNYIKGFPRRYKNKGKPSENQLLHYEKFKILNQFFLNFHGILKIGFGNYLKRLTGRNAAVQYNFEWAFLSDDRNNEVRLNYAAIQLSRGVLFTAGAEKVERISDEQLKVSWNPKTYGLSGALDDEAYILCYTEHNQQVYTPDEVVLRHHGEAYLSCDAVANEIKSPMCGFSLVTTVRKRYLPQRIYQLQVANHTKRLWNFSLMPINLKNRKTAMEN